MRGFLAILVVGMAVTAAVAQESLPLKTVAATKEATVMITTTAVADPGAVISGSGFLMRVEGQTAYVVTNHHVISPPKGLLNSRPTIKVVLRSGTRGERTWPAEVVAASPERDLAIVKIAGVPDLPAPIDVLKDTDPVETMPVYVFGFPFGQALALGRGSPSVVVGKGSVSSVRRDSDGRVTAVLIDGALNPGNSGGPVVDTQGRLVGVAVAAIRGANIGIAIPRPDLLAMLSGRPQGLIVKINAKAARTGMAELSIEVPLLDPFDRVKAITFLYVLGGAGASRPTTNGKGTSWEPLPGASKVELKIIEHRGQGSLAIPAPTGKDVDLTYQIAFDDGEGRTPHTKPGHYLLSAPRAGEPGASAGRLTLWGDVIDPDGDCKIRVEKGGVSLEVPGTLHDLNAADSRVNSPRILQEVEGDFALQVKVSGEFQPSGPATREGALPFNGAGLLVWLDADQFIRLERGAVLRNQKIGAFLLFERYELDQPTVRNNAYVEEGNVYLKIERRGSRISGYYSTDGEQWAETKPMETKWPARLKVGFDAVNSAFSPLSVWFEDFSIRKLGPK